MREKWGLRNEIFFLTEKKKMKKTVARKKAYLVQKEKER